MMTASVSPSPVMFKCIKNTSNNGSIRHCEFEPGSAELKAFPFTDIMTDANLSITGQETLGIPVEELDEIEKAAAESFQATRQTQHAAKGIEGHKKFVSKSVSH